MVPDSSSTSHSTVGLPRLSRISRPTISTMALTGDLSGSLLVRRCSDRRVDAFDQHHVEVLGLALALGPGGNVHLAVVERLGLLVARKAQHRHAVRLPVAFERLVLAAAHQVFA